MVKVNYHVLNNEYFVNYFKFLIGQLYKSLCLKEEESDSLINFLSSLHRELIGNKELISFLRGDARFISLLGKVQYLISNSEIEHKIFKKEIFSCISIVEKLREKICQEGGIIKWYIVSYIFRGNGLVLLPRPTRIKQAKTLVQEIMA